MPRNLSYKDDLRDDLRNDRGFALAYLAAAKADSREAFLVALRDVAEALKGMSQVAAAANVNRENLYRVLSKEGNPRLSTFNAVLDALGLDYEIKRKSSSSPLSPLPDRDTTVNQPIALGATPTGAIGQINIKSSSGYILDKTKLSEIVVFSRAMPPQVVAA